MYLQSKRIEKYQFEVCLKHDIEHDFDVILGKIVLCGPAEVDMSLAFKQCRSTS